MRIILIGLILSFVLSKIYTINPNSQIIGDSGDNYEYFAFQNLVRENIQHGKFPFGWTNTLRYPVGFDLASGYDGSLVVFSGGIVGLFIPLPLAYNLTIVLVLFLNFGLSYLLFKKLSKSEFIGVLSAVIYGFSPYVFARINSHPNLAFIGGFPFFFYSLLYCYEVIKKKSAFALRHYLSLFGSILLVAAGSIQYLIFLIYLVGIFFILAMLNSKSKIQLLFGAFQSCYKSKIKLLFSLFIFIGFTLFLYGGYISHLKQVVEIPSVKYDEYDSCCIPSLYDVFLPNKYITSFYAGLNSSTKSIEKVISIGVIEWIIFLWLTFSVKQKKTKFILLGAFILFILTAKNFINLPLIPEGSRSVILFSLLFVAILSAKKLFLSKYLTVGVILLLLLERLNFNVYSSPLPSPTESEMVKNLPGQAVLDIPVSRYNQYRSILPYFYQKKVVDGYFHYTAENTQTTAFIREDLIQRYICDDEKNEKDTQKYINQDFQDTLNLLRQYDIRSIVLHKDITDKFYFDNCRNVRYFWFNLNPETILLTSPINGIQAKTLILTSYPRLKAQIFFGKSGVASLAGLSIFPRILTDTKIILPYGEIIYPNWEDKKTDIRTDFTPVFSFKVNAGDTLTLLSDINIKEPIYLTVFYAYKPDFYSEEVKPPIEKIYNDAKTEIYRIN